MKVDIDGANAVWRFASERDRASPPKLIGLQVELQLRGRNGLCKSGRRGGKKQNELNDFPIGHETLPFPS